MRLDEIHVQDHSSSYYEKRYSGYGRLYHTEIVHWLLQGVDETSRVLDAGCGTGFVSRCYPWLDITGIDLSPEMLKRHPHQKRAKLMDVCEMDFPSGHFDVVVCRSLLHHLPVAIKGIMEMWRVLKPGGKLVCWETNQAPLAALVRRWTQHGDRFSQYHTSFRDTALLYLLRKGFHIDKVAYQGFVAYPLYGFPDIIDFAKWIPLSQVVYPLTMKVDSLLGKIPGVRRGSFALGVRAHKV